MYTCRLSGLDILIALAIMAAGILSTFLGHAARITFP